MLKKHVKGLGKTGLDIFARRIQAAWPNPSPFADQRTLSDLQKIGLPDSAEDLKKLLDEHWTELDVEGLKAVRTRRSDEPSFRSSNGRSGLI